VYITHISHIKGKMAKAPRLKILRKYYPKKSDEEIIEIMKRDGYEPFHLPAHANEAGEIAFRKRRQKDVD